MDLYRQIISTESREFPVDALSDYSHCITVDWRDAEDDVLCAFLAAVSDFRLPLNLQLLSCAGEKTLSDGVQMVSLQTGDSVSAQHAMLMALQGLCGECLAIRYVHDVFDGDTVCFMVETPEVWTRLEQENPHIRWFFIPIELIPDTFTTPVSQLHAAAQCFFHNRCPDKTGDAAVPSREKGMRDIWLLAATLVVALLYVALLFLQPSGESWGRGWNMIAFLFYSSPAAWLAAAIAFWRRRMSSGTRRTMAVAVATAGAVFPLVCLLVILIRA